MLPKLEILCFIYSSMNESQVQTNSQNSQVPQPVKEASGSTESLERELVSVVVPIYNERECVPLIHKEVTSALEGQLQFEIVFVNDGSVDGSTEALNELGLKDPRVRVIHFRRNFGQTAAMDAGFKAAQGQIVVAMDGDLQNDPKDIPLLVNKIKEGYDLVSGWRKDRKDKALSRKVPSWIANRIIARMTSVRLHDYGCSLKAYKKRMLNHMDLYGEMHRFIPVFAAMIGARITEVVVSHRARVHGQTKYGISRTFRVILDLITVHFLLRFRARPIHYFGWPGFLSFVTGTVICLYLTALKLFYGQNLGDRPLLILGILLIFTGVQFLTIGLLAELLTRIYYESTNKTTYVVGSKLENQKLTEV